MVSKSLPTKSARQTRNVTFRAALQDAERQLSAALKEKKNVEERNRKLDLEIPRLRQIIAALKGEAPVAPVVPMVVAGDPSFEGMGSILAPGHPAAQDVTLPENFPGAGDDFA